MSHVTNAAKSPGYVETNLIGVKLMALGFPLEAGLSFLGTTAIWLSPTVIKNNLPPFNFKSWSKDLQKLSFKFTNILPVPVSSKTLNTAALYYY